MEQNLLGPYSDAQPNYDLAQSVENWHDDQEVLGSIPNGSNFFDCTYFAPSHVSLYLQRCELCII